ncbi:Glycosyltransferase, GT2 family [Amycolatopsis marina]|uniref:Glycosyltransferase, GT2 family n=1 Tax=Amycolatopsis marina TaxID=490629 RepID=A0A1I1CQ73_9PSEU|nr:glycosyltransferase family 2 protein [Amycolatopsis marina]SFB64186.1 Glycosyltransferase, GT2 family [Amycolatopsis marina]
MPRTPASPALRSAPVLAILVCHNGEAWLPLALSALRRSTIRPRHVLAVDTGSTDRTAALLADAAGGESGGADPVLSGVLTLNARTGFAGAVAEAVRHATERWGDPGAWLWLLHDDSAPEPDCLDTLLRAADAAPSAGVLGPLAVDWADPRLIVEAGLSTDASGHRQHVFDDRGSADERSPEQSSEVLAVPSAGALISRRLWESVGGFDPELPLLREDLDFGWRANASGSLVLSVPRARLRHARAVATGRRHADAVPGSLAAADRAYGVRTFLVNCSTPAFLLGLPRLLVLCLLRGLAFAVIRDAGRAHAEFAVLGYLLGGRGGLRSARTERQARRGGAAASVRGLFTSRATRLRNAVRGGVVHLVRRGVEREAALGRLPETVGNSSGASAWIPPESVRARQDEQQPRPVGPDALPAGALRTGTARGTGLRRPGRGMGTVAVTLPEETGTDEGATADADQVATSEDQPSRPSPVRRGEGRRENELVFVEVDRRRILAATLFAPPVVLFVTLTGLALLLHADRLGLDLSGGRLLPVGDLGELWSTYLATWHPVGGGTAAPAPVALAVLGALGALVEPLGGPAALVSLLLIGQLPLAALVAYAATRRLRVGRWVRAAVAAAYALLPAAVAGAVQGRLDVVVAHILLPALLAGLLAVLTRSGARWLSTAVLTALALAVVGAFAPQAHVLALAGLIVGFVLLPSVGTTARRVSSIAIVVLLPLALLLPWLPALFAHPALLAHGLDGPDRGLTTAAELLGLDPGGPGAWPIGAIVVAAALVALVARPSKGAGAGLGVLALGVAGVAVVRLVELTPVWGGEPAAGNAGVPLLFVGAGLLWIVLSACVAGPARPGASPVPALLPRLLAAGGVACLVALAVSGVVLGKQGPLRAGGGLELASSLSAEIADTGRSVLVLAAPGERVRQVGGRLPHYGDDALVPVAGTPERLVAWQQELLAGSREAVTSAAAHGVLFVVLPPGENGAALRQAAGDLVGNAPRTADGRQVLRLTPAAGQVVLVSPEQSRRAISDQAPSGELMTGAAVAEVQADLPTVRVLVSDGPAGRLLVLAANLEPGWQASVNAEPVPIVQAWGHQVAVAVPTREAEVVVEHPSALRDLLLLGQVAAVLFTLLTAIPARRQSPSMMSGSTPR